MILVDIYIPSLDKNYDFQVDGTVSVENLTMEISEMIGNETKSGKISGAEDFMLCSLDQNKVLKKYNTLTDCGIKNGSRLMLV